MSGFRQFLHMGGFAFYVWGAYGLALLVLIANVLAPWFCRRKFFRDAARQMEDET
jgi:heme exporter protein D